MFKPRSQNPDRDFQLFAMRLPPAMSDALRAASERAFESQATLVRRWIQRGLEDLERQQPAGGAR